jgi:hypothetical protein
VVGGSPIPEALGSSAAGGESTVAKEPEIFILIQ